ncbi:UNVERIFIED_CONTAM: hypothetical protein Slati_0395000 [Sesamum latifolium]|uniref:GAG-pre-integrase domain-containing protein n=1 Tax=Sesamum latifolium TaxID=2727402 RepID=A0AAW2XUB1_9LAMI
MTNEIQKKYDKLDDVPSIMLRMKEVYAVPDRHIRYAATKVFFRTKMAEGSSVQSHGVKMLSLLEKLEDLKGGLENDTYIDERLQTSKRKARGSDAGRGRRAKKRLSQPLLAPDAPLLPQRERAKGKLGVLNGRVQMMCACIDKEVSIGRGSVHNSSPTQFDYDCPTQMKADNHENAQLWHARLGHISKNRIKKLVDSKSLEIHDVDNLPTCESCPKEKMTKKPLVGKSAIANSLLDLVHIDVCGPLNTPARGGFSYFITFTDDHSRYGCVYLMKYKSGAFGRFKKYRLEVDNQIGRKIKALRSDEVVSI